DIRTILDCERDWPDTAVVKLEQTYRSTQLILDAAHAVVSHNNARKDKQLWTSNEGGLRSQRFEGHKEEGEAGGDSREGQGPRRRREGRAAPPCRRGGREVPGPRRRGHVPDERAVPT